MENAIKLLDRWGMGLFLCTLTVGIAACEGAETTVPALPESVQELDVQLNDVLVVGQSTSDSSEYSFGLPKYVVTDSQGLFYVADEAVMNIRVFDSSGHFVRTIGQRGAGPLEFLSFNAMTITDLDEFIVLDRMNARITRFSNDGVLQASRPMQTMANNLIRPFQSEFLVLSNDAPEPGYTDHLFRVYDSGFQETSTAFGSADEVMDVDEVLEQIAFSFDPGSFINIEGKVLYAPSLYDGRIHVYAEQDGQWIRSRQLRGLVEKPAYTKAKGDDQEADIELRYAGQLIRAVLHNKSQGIFRLKSREIVHFTFCEFGTERLFGVEVFDPRGELTGYGIIDKVPVSATGTASLMLDIAWKDEQDRFYIIDRTETPVIRVVELEISPSS